MSGVLYQLESKTIQDLINLHEDDALNLEPGFQRDSVWKDKDREALLDTVVRGWPLPAIFLYRREDRNAIVYDVIDGKQRIESILMFTGEMRGHRFRAKVQLPDREEAEWIDWNGLARRGLQHIITGYRIPTVEVRGDFSDIVHLFVRINSTGKALTRAETRKAKYYKSQFLKVASRLASRYEDVFVRNRILSPTQLTRMKHVELICELMLSIHQNGVLNKKAALDRIMESEGFTDIQVQRARNRTVTALNRTLKMFPSLRETRFRQISDFYTLVFLTAQFDCEGLILTDRRRNRLADDLLVAFSNGIDEVRLRQQRAQGIRHGAELYRDYLVTVLEGTDAVSKRQRRADILRNVLQSLFARKDAQRGFSSEQRRIIWNTSARRVCQHPGCGLVLTWEDFTIDHIQPYSKGGRTRLDNAALMCRKHNAAKGNRSRRRPRRAA
jgi:5-methylcytosine-specific restriction endonuclease McrA